MTDALTDQLDPAELTHLDRCRAGLASAQAALGSFGAYLAGKYGLGQGDRVRTDGAIERVAAAPDS